MGNEKHAILVSWASDACAAEAAPALRRAPGADRPLPIDEILEALRELDKQANELAIDAAASRRLARRQAIERFRSRRTTDQGDTGCDPSH